ncbi:cell division protein FtsQ [Aerococcus agrisoli]|uniref:Cell division protein FtsQ n=1 Tax=Aerococcus agrisoli TaxID=2487350 RepID=A0A3N4GHB6_9LACT|nr:cell division protein FtsQ/DivIB [Aerococcus agrisoli]RPA60827.1 cell division protein FtsQ [Aerococcus agrisoli]
MDLEEQRKYEHNKKLREQQHKERMAKMKRLEQAKGHHTSATIPNKSNRLRPGNTTDRSKQAQPPRTRHEHDGDQDHAQKQAKASSHSLVPTKKIPKPHLTNLFSKKAQKQPQNPDAGHKINKPKNKEKHVTPWRKRLLFLAPFVISLVISGYFVSPLNHVSSISVEGVDNSEAKLNLSPLKTDMSVFQLGFKTADVEKSIVNQNPSIKSAVVEVENYNQVTVSVSPFRQIGYIKNADFFYPLLENDQILDTPIANLEKELPLFEGFDMANEQERAKMTEAVEAIASLSDDIIQQIDYVSYMGDDTNDDRIALQMVDGNVVVGFISSIGERMSYYNGILKQLDGQTGLIDMEVAIYFTELNAGNNPYASEEDKKAYEESVAAESAATSEVSSSALSSEAVSSDASSASASGTESSVSGASSGADSTSSASAVDAAASTSSTSASSTVESQSQSSSAE